MRTAIILFAILVVTGPALAGPGPARPAYRASGFLRTGYSDKAVRPGQWTVRGSARAAGKSVGVALYRAAELADQAGATELRVTKQRIKSQALVDRATGYQRSYHEATELSVRAIRTDQDRDACDMTDRARCMTLPIAGIMATYGPQLLEPAARPGVVPVAPLRIVTASPYERDIADFLARNPTMRAPAPAVPTPPRPTAALPSQPVTVATARVQAARPSPAAVQPTAAERYAAQLRAVQPVRSGPGWTIGD